MNDRVRQLAETIWDYHHMNHRLEKADAILVLCSHDTAVADRGAELFHEAWAPLLVFSGGRGAITSRLWTEPEVSLAGRFFNCEGIKLLPRTLQQPRPPIWVTANSDPDSFRWIGERGYDLMTLPWLFPPQRSALFDYTPRRSGAAAGAVHA